MQNGQPVVDYSKMLKVASYIKDMDAVEKNLIQYGKTLGERKVRDEAENASLDKSGETKAPVVDLFAALNQKLTNR
jgi:hypothetical protein